MSSTPATDFRLLFLSMIYLPQLDYSMWRKILAVAAGYIAIGLLVVVTDSIAGATIPGFRTLTTPPMKYLITTLLTDSAYTVLGGYLCALIARASARGAMIGLIVFGELMGLVSAVVSWTTQPHWFATALLILYPPMVWLGYVLAPARKRAAVQAGP